MNFYQSPILKGLLASLLAMGSLTACTSGTIEIEGPKSDFQAATTEETSNNLCGQLVSPLTDQELEYAATAWQYFVNNRQPETGFTNSANQFPSGTLWDQGNYLMALNAVRWMGLIDQGEFDQQLNQFLTALGNLPLVEDALPNKVYNSATGEMVDYSNQPTQKGLGWSALDIGRFLTALHIIRTCHSQYDDWISGLMSSWQLPRSIEDGQLYGAIYKDSGKLLPVQEGRLGYEEYAARGYELWGFEAPKALEIEPMKLVDVSGIKIPVDQRNFEDTDANNYVVSESYILEAIEFGWDDTLAKYAEAILTAQENRYKETGYLTAVSEDNIDQAPHFLYSTLYANGTPWAVITEKNESHAELRTLSTKAAFGWYYLFPQKPYTLELFKAVQELQDPDGGGFYAGLYEESNETNAILSGNTNGLILEILYYKALGNKAILDVIEQ